MNNLQRGDTLVCVDNSDGLETFLTIGKSYLADAVIPQRGGAPDAVQVVSDRNVGGIPMPIVVSSVRFTRKAE